MPTRLEKWDCCVYCDNECINKDCNSCLHKDGYFK